MRTARPFCIAEDGGTIEQVAVLAVSLTHPVFRRPETARARDRLTEPGPNPFAILGMQRAGPRVALEFVGLESHQVPQGGRPPDLLRLELPVPQHVVGGLDELFNPLLAVLQRSRDALALGDVGQDRQ